MNTYLAQLEQLNFHKTFYFEQRHKFVKKYSWAIPNQAALEVLREFSPIVEIGAGNGYWNYEATKLGAEIVSFDICPGEQNEYGNTKPWTTVHKGGHKIVKEYQDKTLFLCWPCYDEPWAYEAIKLYQGLTVIYVGEGKFGCTGDDRFHNYLEEKFKLIREIYLPQYPGIYDSLYVYQRL